MIGSNGSDGERGRRGKPGPPGEPGARGLKGDKGDASTHLGGVSGTNCSCEFSFTFLNEIMFKSIENEAIHHHCACKQTKKMVKILILCKKSRIFLQV